MTHHDSERSSQSPTSPNASTDNCAPTTPISTAASNLGPSDYLQKILTARVYDVAKETALQYAPRLSQRLGNQILLKREDQQPVFSYKIRGAYNKMSTLSAAQLEKGVICASAGNHAQGVAYCARHLNTKAVVVMPTTTPQVKIDAVLGYGAQVVLFGENYSDAYQHSLELEKKEGLNFIHPFDDPEVIAGQGTIASEILRQVQSLCAPAMKRLDAVFVGIGGGGCIAGIASYIKAVAPHIKVIGVQMVDSNAMVQSVEEGELVDLEDVGLFSDGTAVKKVGAETFRIVKELVDEFIEVNTDEVCAAIKDIFIDTRSIVEPAGALAVAAIKLYCEQNAVQGESYAAILSGANMNFERLRFVAERAQVGEELEALFAVTMPEERGSFRRFCEALQSHNITEFNYRMSSADVAHVFVGVSTRRGESGAIAAQLAEKGFATLDLTHDEMAQEHIRHMVGGRPGALAVGQSLAKERLMRFEFPERPGALMRFLSRMQPEWNISLFHYRNQGSDYGRILIGLQVPEQDEALFQRFLTETGYPYADESHNPLYHLFLS